jgi:hypothetical protein
MADVNPLSKDQFSLSFLSGGTDPATRVCDKLSKDDGSFKGIPSF